MEMFFEIVFFITAIVAVSTIIVAIFHSNVSRCSGNCHQGKKSCDCGLDND